MNKNQEASIKKLFEQYQERYEGIENRVKFPLSLNEFADKYTVSDDSGKFIFEVLRLNKNRYKFSFGFNNYYSSNILGCMIIAMARYFDYKMNIQDNLNQIFDVYPVLRTVTEGEL